MGRPLHWRRNGVSNHQPRDCLLSRLFRRRSKKTSKLRVTGLCAGNSPAPVNSPHKGPVTRKMVPFDDVIMHCDDHVRVPYMSRTGIWNITVVHGYVMIHIEAYSDTYMHQVTRLLLVQVMACRLCGSKPLLEPMTTYYQLDPQKHTSLKLESIYHFQNFATEMNVIYRSALIPTCISNYIH